jgi:ABC-type nitrate/sulfonate/bicarbonate transport system substrate-binding protein
MRTRGRLALVVAALLLAGPAGAQVPRPGTLAPDLASGPWINSAPLTLAALRGRVVLVEFWTYG